jgi:hypothetical protein
MSEKSYVSLEQRVCVVCGVRYDTNTILLDRRLRPSLEHRTVTGYGLCESHQESFDTGYVALIECLPQSSGNPSHGAMVKPGQERRTGRVAYLKREACAVIFNIPIAPTCPCVWVEPTVLELLQSKITESTDGDA